MPLAAEDISKRLNAIGGIFRHVFAPDFNSVLEEQRVGISELDPNKFKLNKIDRNLPQVSHYVAQYVVTTEGVNAYQETTLDDVSDGVLQAAEAHLTKMDLNEKILILIQNDKGSKNWSSSCPLYYEDVIAGQLLEGVD